MDAELFESRIQDASYWMVEGSSGPGLSWRQVSTVTTSSLGIVLVSSNEYERVKTELPGIVTNWQLLGYLAGDEAMEDGHAVGCFPFQVSDVKGLDDGLFPFLTWAIGRDEELEPNEMLKACMSLGIEVFARVLSDFAPFESIFGLPEQLSNVWLAYRQLCREYVLDYSLQENWEQYAEGDFDWQELIGALRQLEN